MARGFLHIAALLSAALFSAPVHAVVIERPLNVIDYGYTSHADRQQVFQDFTVSTTGELREASWYGQFSDGLNSNNQPVGAFDFFLFNNDPNILTQTGQGTIVDGLPSGAAILASSFTDVIGLETDQSDLLHGGDIRRWTVDILDFELAPGRYWLSVRASSSEPGFFLWNHSSSDPDDYTVSGSTNSLNEPSIHPSDQFWDTQAFSLEIVSVPAAGHTMQFLAFGLCSLFFLKKLRE